MAFFFSDNPIALFLGLVLILTLLKIYLTKHSWFSGKNKKHALYILPLLIFLGIFLVGYSGILSVISFSTPLIVLVIVFLFFIATVMYVMGVPRSEVYPIFKSMGALKVGVVILIICIVALGASRLMGDALLEEKSVSLGDVMMTQHETVDVDFSWLFSKAALGLIFVVVVVGIAFVWINTGG